MKLVIHEPESAALRGFVERTNERVVSSALVRTELRRAAWRFVERVTLTPQQRQETAAVVGELLRRLDLIRVGSAALDRAGGQPPQQLRSLDAIHLVTALMLGPDLRAVVCYDHRLTDAARAAGLTVVSPARANGR